MQIKTIDWSNQSSSSNQSSIITKTIQHDLHPTGLESFMACPYKYHVENTPDIKQQIYKQYNISIDTPLKSRLAFAEWDYTEQLMTAYMYWEKLWDEILKYFGNSTESLNDPASDDKHSNYQRLFKHAENWKKYISDPNTPQNIKDRYPLFTQKRMIVRILMPSASTSTSNSIHEIYLTWTADWIFSDWTIWDCKAYKSKRSSTDAQYKLQWQLYPRMRYEISRNPALIQATKNNWKDYDYVFTYYIFTKQATPQLQILEMKWTYDNSERLIFHILSEYVKAYDTDNREPKKSLQCRWCPLRKVCPLYWEDWMASATTNQSTNSSSSGTDTLADWLNQVNTEPAQVSQEERRF